MNISTQPGAPRYSGSHLQQKKTRGAKRKKKKKNLEEIAGKQSSQEAREETVYIEVPGTREWKRL